MRRLFDDELNDIDANFTEMGMMVSDAIGKAVKAFIDHDRDLAQEIIDHDTKINEREVFMKGIDVSYYYEGYDEYNIHDLI